MYQNKSRLFFISALFLISILVVAGVGSTAQAAQCAAGQTFCNGICQTTYSGPTTDATCSGTGHARNACGTCVCTVNNTASCADTSACLSITSCSAGETFDACARGGLGACTTPYALVSPSLTHGPQSGYIAVTGSGNPAAAPLGAVYSYTGGGVTPRLRLQVTAGNWQDVGANYTADRNIDIVRLASNQVAVIPDPTFDKLRIGVPATTLINPGDLALNSGSSLALIAPTISGVDTSFKISGPVRSDASSLGLTINAPSGKNSELRLSQSNADKWALSLRGGSTNFEVWRNPTGAEGAWVDAPLQINNSTGLVNVTNNLKVGTSATTLLGDEGLGVEKNLSVSGVSLLQGNTAVGASLSVGEDVVMNSGKTIAIHAPSVAGADTRLIVGGVIRPDADSLGLAVNAPAITNAAEVLLGQSNAYRWALSLRPDSEFKDFAIWRNPTGAEGAWLDAPLQISNPSGNVILSHDLRVSGRVNGQKLVLSRTYPPTSSPDITATSLVLAAFGDARIIGDARIDGALAINGALTGVTSFSSATLDLSGTGATAITSNGNGGGMLRIGSAIGNNVLRVDGNEISTSGSSSLNLQTHSTGWVRVANDLWANGVLRTGPASVAYPNGVPLTSATGGLKMAELANEDWGAGVGPGPKGTLMIGVGSQDDSSHCTTVCQNHGLRCGYTLVIGTTNNSVAFGSCGAASGTQGIRLCGCGS